MSTDLLPEQRHRLIVEAALGYVARGWRVVQLHDVAGRTDRPPGVCSCHLADQCKSAGKHPVLKAWQAAPIATEMGVREAWSARPAANVGVATGPISGVWVLDVDPLHDGYALLAGLEREHGALPPTYEVLTGSGGKHYYFSYAGISWDLTNSRGSLPIGLDIRGRGGFVVAPPSLSGVGPYFVLRNVAPATLG